MASVLCLPASSPLRDSYSNRHGSGHSCSSMGSARSSGTVQHHRQRSLSGSSLSSLTSLPVPPFRRRQNDSSESRLSSSQQRNSSRRPLSSSDQDRTPQSVSARPSFASSFITREVAGEHASKRALYGVFEHETESNANGEDEESLQDDGQSSTTDDRPPDLQGPHDAKALVPDEPAPPTSPVSTGFQRWVSTLRRKKLTKPQSVTPRLERWTLDDFDTRPPSPKMYTAARHRKSNSCSSSLRFVTAVKSATVTLASASASIATASRRRQGGHRRSSLMSGTDPRPSVDSGRSMVDEAAKQRARKRREKVEELIRTEESYVADLRALSNAYFTILGHQPTAAAFARPSAQKNITEILQFHDELLGQLYRIVPFAEYDQKLAKITPESVTTKAHTRWHSVDVVPTLKQPAKSLLATVRSNRRSLSISKSSDDDHLLLQCAPQTVAGVAKAFSASMDRFALYEEYGANYELVLGDIDETQRSIATWLDYDRGIEALSAHLNPMKSREINRRRAMTVKDLLIKPVQRLPRYELLFNDLCKLTPVCDDPDANVAIQSLLAQLNNCCRRMNRAKDDHARARSLETTWILGDRLTFSDQVPRTIFQQLLGCVRLCGCLYLAYRSKDRIKGMYVICVLYESTLLLATADEDQPRYSTLAGIALANATIAECDNSKGLQCYTAPHSWKLVFEHSARMYEIILVACSATEADVWRQHITTGTETHIQAVSSGQCNVFELQSPLTADMRSCGKAFGKPGSFVRRMSVHRTATIGATSDLSQVIIKNTQAVKEAVDSSSSTSLQIPRSQSVATPSHVQTLAPRRAERARLESLLSDVWSKDQLPYPSMTPRRSDPIRASANHVIRKFSMASITSNFSSKRSNPSSASILDRPSRKEDVPPRPVNKLTRSRDLAGDSSGSINTSSSNKRRPLVDFHNAPEAFLPADFELREPGQKQRKGKSAFRTFTMTMERPFSPLLDRGDAKASASSLPSSSWGLRRAQSVRDVTEQRRSAQFPQLGSTGGSSRLPDDEKPVCSVVKDQNQQQGQGQQNRVPAKLQKRNPMNDDPVKDDASATTANADVSFSGAGVLGGKDSSTRSAPIETSPADPTVPSKTTKKSRSKLLKLFG